MAKIASDERKPDGQTRILPTQEAEWTEMSARRVCTKRLFFELSPSGSSFFFPFFLWSITFLMVTAQKAVLAFMDQLPVRKIPGCGKVSWWHKVPVAVAGRCGRGATRSKDATRGSWLPW